ncbi:hypothetical protein ES692_07385 [Psychroserpens burtonensis]|uniref:Uncharacterized protein n=1 Tax=Psychroserpens burtonensis TaxID=49278 RepID=A0A5C7B7H2_9FLAO|nr:hypothetical protein [Psychroserpens burtonensis]TXE18060.1 hypothetical protein ES692_07385 [Psychroserpens burtonensis]
MKKVLTILAFTLLPFLSIGQEDNEDIKNNDTIEIVIEKTLETNEIKQETVSSSTMKAKVLKLNRKKSSEIISIKAYRKSLQIKVKTIKLC